MRRMIFYITVMLFFLFLINGCGRKEGPLTVYVVETDALYREAVQAYVSAHPEREVNVVLFESYDRMNERMNAELLSGGGPDVLLFNSLYSQADPYKMSVGGSLKKLDAQVSALAEEEYFTDIINAGKMDGHQYFIPFSWNIYQAYSSEEKLAQKGYTEDLYLSLTKEYQALDGKEKDCAVYDMGLLRTDILNFYMETLGTEIIDCEEGKINGEKDAAAKAAGLVKQYYDSEKKMRQIMQYWGGDFAGASEHVTYLLEDAPFMHTVRYYQSMYQVNVGETAVLHYFEKPEGGVSAQVIQYGAINANTANEEAAWELMKYILDAPVSTDFTRNEFHMYSYTPVNRGVYGDCVDELCTKPGKARFAISPLNADNADLLREIPGKVKGAVIPNVIFGELIQECVNPYLMGEKTFETCYEVLTDKVRLYLQE